MNDLGTKAEKTPCLSEKMDEPSYPSFCVRDKAMEEFLGGNEVDVGDEFEVRMKVRVTGIRNDEYGKSLDMKVLESDDLELEPKKSKESDKDEDAD